MKMIRLTFNALALAVFSLALGSLAQAQTTRTWISGTGDDVNLCTRTAPCKTFAGAIIKTLTNGEVNILDSGSFGNINILRSMTFDGGGMFAGITGSSVTGVTINLNQGTTADPQQRITLRNLSINGPGSSPPPA